MVDVRTPPFWPLISLVFLFGCAGTENEEVRPTPVTAGIVSAECRALKSAGSLNAIELLAVYQCASPRLAAGYREGSKRWIPRAYVEDYSAWPNVASVPTRSRAHGDRYVMISVNPVGEKEFLRYAEPRGPMPSGTLVAMESFALAEDGELVQGPLWLMEKVTPGTSPRSNDWFYMAVGPDGHPMAVDVYGECHVCHAQLSGTDGLGYPPPSARIVEKRGE